MPMKSIGAWLATSPDTRSIMLQATGKQHGIESTARINTFDKLGRPSVAVIKVQCNEGTLDDNGDLLAYQLDLSLNKFLGDTGSHEKIVRRSVIVRKARFQSKSLGEGF
jgi:hypothetical protein